MYQLGDLYMKAQFVIDLLKSNANRFTPAQLEKVAGSPRRARRALFLARKEGVKLEAIRDNGRTVTAYVFSDGALPTIAAKPAKAKAAKAPSAKAAAKAKVTKGSLESAVRKINASSKVKKSLATAKTDEDIAAIKAKNLATMKAVSSKQKLHPVTKRPLTDEQDAVLTEFAQMEREAEAEREDREFARASVREYLTKEVYAE
jgi:hypothetical protein